MIGLVAGHVRAYFLVHDNDLYTIRVDFIFLITLAYMKEDFLPVAHSIINEITNMKLDYLMESENKSFDVPEVLMKRFPYPEYLSDDLLPVLRSFISIMIMLSFNYTCINVVRVIATEKEKQLKVCHTFCISL